MKLIKLIKKYSRYEGYDRSVDSPERAADVQSSFVLEYFHAATADRGVYVLIDPRPWDRWHLCQIDRPRNAAHIVTAMPDMAGHVSRQMLKHYSHIQRRKTFFLLVAEIPGILQQQPAAALATT